MNIDSNNLATVNAIFAPALYSVIFLLHSAHETRFKIIIIILLIQTLLYWSAILYLEKKDV